MTAPLDRLWPDPTVDLSDGELLTDIGQPCLRMNFVESIDGAVTRDGRVGSLSGTGDRRFFHLLRRWADVVLVAAGTIRNEGYAAMRVDGESVRWRIANGRTAHPAFAIVTSSLDLDEDSLIFSDAPQRPILLTTPAAAGREAHRFEGVADVIAFPGVTVPGAEIASTLRARGLHRILSEGGPELFGTLLEADVVDELCVTIEPTLEAGQAGRIARGPGPSRDMRLAAVLKSGDTLLLRYSRTR